MTISAEVILDSINESGDRITTLVLNYPRFIHSEFMTHRVFSRNAASSRAVPTETMIERMYLDPARPIHWGKNQRGMQAGEQLSPESIAELERLWDETMDCVTKNVKKMLPFHPHKQTINRLLEPWMHMQTLVTATEWENFFDLRDHPAAQPEIQGLAWAIKDAMIISVPELKKKGEWHIPFIKKEEMSLPTKVKLKISTARCARTSYFFHDGKESDVKQDLELHDRLVGSHPIHASPTEHQAQALGLSEFVRNVCGWEQYRVRVEKSIPREPRQQELF